ncbi:C component of insecticidal toxin complex, partial [Salmonella enterica subsp. diarizonae]|nr:C component of insecticidal toxin complex [Salmonella enterica subsp. diarizonae]
MQARVGALRQKAAGVVLMTGDALTGHMRGVGVAVIRVVAHGQSAVVEDRDRRGVTE